jgi:hypothetical protein
LLLGPLLRHVGRETATIWVEVDKSCRVRILDSEEATFEVAGHHYALVRVEGLSEGTITEYTVELDGEQVASFRNAWSCGTSTAASVPCMFSHLGRDGFEGRTADFENLLDVIRHAGMAVLWIDNQSGCKGVCERVASFSTAGTQDPALCADGECSDEVMLQGLDARIAALPAAQRARGVVLVRPLTTGDREDWTRLWTAYLVFYETELKAAQYDLNWARLFDPAEVYGR